MGITTDDGGCRDLLDTQPFDRLQQRLAGRTVLVKRRVRITARGHQIAIALTPTIGDLILIPSSVSSSSSSESSYTGPVARPKS